MFFNATHKHISKKNKKKQKTASLIKSETASIKAGIDSTDRSNYGPILLLLSPEKLAVITINVAINMCLANEKGLGEFFFFLLS